ncbi:hypothetical protein FRC01_003278 [Tulasnella sp. 417]|nr:hypothetical protein FRC01_003278 [Tulasnella sp. 417]
MYQSKSFYCPFCHAGPFPKRFALASHVSQCAQCSTAALAQARKHINPPVDDRPSIVAPQSPPALVFDNPSEPPELELDRSASPDSETRPTKRPRNDDPPSSYFNTFSLLFPKEKSAGQAHNYHGTPFETQFQSQTQLGKEPWDPFADEDEWELADWFMTAEVSQEDINKYLKLKITRQRTHVSFKDKQQFFKKVDALPCGPKWERIIMTVKGDQLGPDGRVLTESLEIWARDPVECVKEILGNPSFKDEVSYSPRKEYLDPEMRQRVYTEMATADWWWKVQERLPKGATIASVIIASDKTQLSRMGGDKSAWPVYITIGNIGKATRRKPSQHATILLGYLPVTKLEIFSHTATRQLMGQDLFHRSMKLLLEPLERAGRAGVQMVCPDGYARKVYPILAAYIADHPEQCLVTCTKENRCPQCKYPGRNQTDTLTILKCRASGDPQAEEEAREEGLRATYPPFWANLPHTDIFSCITPDILHQIHKGMFKSHLFEWCQAILGTAEMDQRFSAMPSHPSLRHFHRGVSHLTQWTGKEAKQLERVFVGTMVGAVDNRTLTAIRALLDFFVLAQYDTHTDESLELMEESLSAFHKNKHYAFGNQRDQFNFPKLHSLVHYTSAIRSLGTLDGYNTELPEQLHIDFAKKAYSASNKRDYIVQMTVWLRRQEAIHRLRSYIAWVRPLIETPRNPDGDSDGEASDK